MEKKYDVFLCHNSKDKTLIRNMADAVKANGMEAFIDANIRTAETWTDEIYEAITSSKAVAVFLSGSGVTKWMEEEIRTAIGEVNKEGGDLKVFTVLLPGADEKKVATSLKNRQWLDCRQGIKNDEIPSLFVDVLKGVIDINNPNYSTVNRFSEIEFTNRKQELKQLDPTKLRTYRCPYTLVSAPPGYGKSHLLTKLVQDITGGEIANGEWVSKHVNFQDCEKIKTDQIDYLLSCIYKKDYDVLRRTLSQDDLRQVEQAIKYLLKGLKTGNGRTLNLLLIFDYVEILEEEALDWICDLLHQLRNSTLTEGREMIVVRTIISGRKPEEFWAYYKQKFTFPLAPYEVPLEPFGKSEVQNFIWDYICSEGKDDFFDDNMLADFADEVLFLSGGHPEIMRKIVEDIAELGFAMGPTIREYFHDKQDSFIRKYLSSVAKKFLLEFSKEQRKLVEPLSAFRLVQSSAFSHPDFLAITKNDVDPIKVMQKLTNESFLIEPKWQEYFYKISFMRKVISLYLVRASGESGVHFRAANKAAIKYFENLIPNGKLGGNALVEWLYHTLVDDDLENTKVLKQLRSYFSVVNTGDVEQGVKRFIDVLKDQDFELSYMLRRRFGADYVIQIKELLEA